LKYVWELNRHQYLMRWINDVADNDGDGDAANAVIQLILSWIKENPRRVGRNWASALECAIRAIVWSELLTRHEFDVPRYAEARLLIIDSIIEQCEFIRQNLSRFSSANNHLIGELTGLVCAAGAFPLDIKLKYLGNFAWPLAVEQFFRQEYPSGVNREQAAYYHWYVAEYAQLCCRYAADRGQKLADLKSLYGMMARYLCEIGFAPGKWFEYGDRDDGCVLSPPTRFDCPPANDGLCIIADAGHAVFSHASLKAFVRGGNFGFPDIAAHAHCDQLSICIAYGEMEILTDSGTYCYHSDENWRRYFKGTTAHNTIRVDEQDQAEYAGPFLWKTHADAKIESSSLNPPMVRLSHNGYLRLPDPVLHSREIQFGTPFPILILDEIGGQTSDHSYELVYNFGPGMQVILRNQSENECELAINSPAMPPVRMSISSDIPISTMLHFGDDSVPAGFYSRRFGEKIPIFQFRAKTHGVSWKVKATLSAATCAE
jgi:hypothetical protein